MAVTRSPETELDLTAPAFKLPAAQAIAGKSAGDLWSLEDFEDAQVLVVVFTCNHCPYAQHVEDVLVKTANEYKDRGVAFVAICPNDAERYPADNMDAMRERAEKKKFPFPYLRDDLQEVTHNYGARCTPDPFVFDRDRTLAYRGQIDETRPKGSDPATGKDLKRALDELLDQGEVTMEQRPAVGCSIKWKL